jgi:hypothetical protein
MCSLVHETNMNPTGHVTRKRKSDGQIVRRTEKANSRDVVCILSGLKLDWNWKMKNLFALFTFYKCLFLVCLENSEQSRQLSSGPMFILVTAVRLWRLMCCGAVRVDCVSHPSLHLTELVFPRFAVPIFMCLGTLRYSQCTTWSLPHMR